MSSSANNNNNNNKGGVVMAAEEQSNSKEERSGLGAYIWSFLTGSHKKCRSKISVKRKNKNNKTKEDKKHEGQPKVLKKTNAAEEDEDSDGGTFGIQKTEKLKCFVKPKPPINRRRPTSSVVSSRLALSSASYDEIDDSKHSQCIEETLPHPLQEISEEDCEGNDKSPMEIPSPNKETQNIIDSESERRASLQGGDRESQDSDSPSTSHKSSPIIIPSSDSLKGIHNNE